MRCHRPGLTLAGGSAVWAVEQTITNVTAYNSAHVQPRRSGAQKPGRGEAGFPAQGFLRLKLKCLVWSLRSSSEPIWIVPEFNSLQLQD